MSLKPAIYYIRVTQNDLTKEGKHLTEGTEDTKKHRKGGVEMVC